MKLQVIKKPRLGVFDDPCTRKSTVVVDFDPTKAVIVVNCDVDVITLGVALSVLGTEYERCLAQLSPELIEKIKETIKKVLE